MGTKLELEHHRTHPVGMTVTCESELTAVEGRKLVFKVSLYDEKGPVGGGVHERFVVNDAKFAAKAESKKAKTLFLGKLDGRRVGSQQLLLGPGLSFLQKPCRLFAGTEQL